MSQSPEPLVSPLSADSVSGPDLLPGGASSPSLVGHPGDPVVSLGPCGGGCGECAQSELTEVVTVQRVDGHGGPVGGSGTADEVVDFGANGHTSIVDDKTEKCQEMMTPDEPSPDAMSVRNPYAELARKWQGLAEVSRPDERAALSLMVADLWRTIDEDVDR